MAPSFCEHSESRPLSQQEPAIVMSRSVRLSSSGVSRVWAHSSMLERSNLHAKPLRMSRAVAL